MSLRNTQRREPRANEDDEEEEVEEDEDERDEAVTGGGASSDGAPVERDTEARSGGGTSALSSLSRGDVLRIGDMDRARRCTEPLRSVSSRPRAGPCRRSSSSLSSSLPGSRSGSGDRVSGRIWPFWKSSSAEIMCSPGPPNSNSASPMPPYPAPFAAPEAADEDENSRWWMGLAGALKK
ncbi:hypothetical protein BRADI_1g64698v3 [Brachypodium distachyon]|uniref:Uncharacterized protein n=1 Tax=Brachypodium distachyon TaxID=15368 RepID=A0A2K2DTE6_BRADI|nr:hypothetical protein BRADI_1g64698v3 [Brachypodium distachyon]